MAEEGEEIVKENRERSGAPAIRFVLYSVRRNTSARARTRVCGAYFITTVAGGRCFQSCSVLLFRRDIRYICQLLNSQEKTNRFSRLFWILKCIGKQSSVFMDTFLIWDYYYPMMGGLFKSDYYYRFCQVGYLIDVNIEVLLHLLHSCIMLSRTVIDIPVPCLLYLIQFSFNFRIV